MIKYKDLSVEYQRSFDKTQISVQHLVGIWSDEDIYDFFFRVQNGKTLTNGELFRSMIHNKFVQQIKQYHDNDGANLMSQIIKMGETNRQETLELFVVLTSVQHTDSFEKCKSNELLQFVSDMVDTDFDKSLIVGYMTTLSQCFANLAPHKRIHSKI